MATGLEILISTMERTDLSFLKKMFPYGYGNAHLLIVNQSASGKRIDVTDVPSAVKVLNTEDKGLSRSRNLALRHASGDFLLLADDDVVFDADFAEKVIAAFEGFSETVLIFPLKNESGERIGEYRTDSRLLTRFDMVYSPQMGIRRGAWMQNPVYFDERFGLGAEFPDGENYIFLNEMYRKGHGVRYVDTGAFVMHAGINSSYYLERDENFKARLALWKRCGKRFIFFRFIKLLLFLLKEKKIKPSGIPKRWKYFREISAISF
jgi:glycosyltransferase involved in cell wall biosynthesis